MELDIPQRVLVVVAHPDDVDFGAAGTIAAWTAKGSVVSYLIVTDGEAGGSDDGVSRVEMRAIRREEQTKAASKVGVNDVRFLGWPDGSVVADLSLRREVARVIRAVRPERVLCPSPERDYMRLPVSHPDHLAVGEATLCAIYPDARNVFAFPELVGEGLTPHTVLDLWLMAAPQANHFVDITECIDQKIDALLSHESQIADPAGLAARIRAFTSERAQALGLGAGHFVEEFFVVTIPF